MEEKVITPLIQDLQLLGLKEDMRILKIFHLKYLKN